MIADRTLNGLVTLSAVAVVLAVGTLLWKQRPLGDPVRYYDPVTITPTITPGESLVVGYSYDKTRVCVSQIQYRGKGEDGASLALGQVTIGGLDPGVGTVKTRLPIDPGLPPGKYVWWVSAAYSCSDGDYVMRSPTAPFEIVEP